MIEAQTGLSPEIERLTLFKENAELTGSQVDLCADEAEVVEAVTRSIQFLRPDSPVLAAFCGALPEALIEDIMKVTGRTTGPSREAASSCAIGLTDAVAGVASSGSVVVPVDSGMVALVSVLVRHQLVILEETRLFSRPGDVIEQIDGDFVFVTGPSATADMGALVRGVHGPHSLKIIVLKNRS